MHRIINKNGCIWAWLGLVGSVIRFWSIGPLYVANVARRIQIKIIIVCSGLVA